MKLQCRNFHEEKAHIQKDETCKQGHHIFDIMLFKYLHGTKIAKFSLIINGKVTPAVVPPDKKPFIPFRLKAVLVKTADKCHSLTGIRLFLGLFEKKIPTHRTLKNNRYITLNGMHCVHRKTG